MKKPVTGLAETVRGRRPAQAKLLQNSTVPHSPKRERKHAEWSHTPPPLQQQQQQQQTRVTLPCSTFNRPMFTVSQYS
jgi:hypothetical protein